MPGEAASLRGSVAKSLLFHALLAATALTYGLVGKRGPSWGNSLNGGSAIHVKAVASLPGIPLPPPAVATHNTVAVENPGLYQTEPIPQPPPSPDVRQIPKFKEAIKVKKLKGVNTRIQKQKVIPPSNAVPFGEGGQPTMAYSPVINSEGSGGIAFGQGDFGDQFGWYVDAVRSRISGNWLLSTISPSIINAPRVYVDFDILRDGTITNVRIKQSSGIAEVDRSALRAVLASNPLAPLPQAYSGSKVSVDFYFDLHR